MAIKLVAVDIDGTLLTDDRHITPEVYQAIQEAKQKGVHIIIATGRPIAGVTALLDELNLREKGDYVITFNGGLVQETATAAEIIKTTFDYSDYLAIEYLSRQLNVPMHATTHDGIYTANRNIGRYTIYEANLVSMPVFYRTPEEMADKEIIKMMYVAEPEVLDAIIPQIPKDFYEKYTIVKSTPFYLEFMPKETNKGTAIKHLAEKLGLDMTQTMAIGDAENDRAMLEAVAHPVVMANGTDDIKAIAKHITKSNQESGVAYALRKWVLN